MSNNSEKTRIEELVEKWQGWLKTVEDRLEDVKAGKTPKESIPDEIFDFTAVRHPRNSVRGMGEMVDALKSSIASFSEEQSKEAEKHLPKQAEPTGHAPTDARRRLETARKNMGAANHRLAQLKAQHESSKQNPGNPWEVEIRRGFDDAILQHRAAKKEFLEAHKGLEDTLNAQEETPLEIILQDPPLGAGKDHIL